MLAYVLALVVGLGSFALYMAAFFLPEVHRKNDFIWSGIGLFYALVLWVCAGRITGGVLLGQMASVSLLGWLGWQTLTLRRHVASPDQQTPLPTVDDLKASLSSLSSPEGRSQLAGQVSRIFAQIKEGVQGAVLKKGDTNAAVPKPRHRPMEPTEEAYVPPTLEEFGTAGQEAAKRFARVAIADQEAARNDVSEPIENAKASASEVVGEDTVQAASDAVEQVNDVAEDIAQTASDFGEEAKEEAKETVADAPRKTTHFFKGAIASVQSVFKGLTQKKEPKPIYVRKQYRDAEPEPEAIAAPGEAESTIDKPATAELIEPETEVVSEEIVPDLVGVSPTEATAEEIVEDLLEDISAQEASAPINVTETDSEVRAVPLHLPNQEIVDAAIADAEEKTVPYDPPGSEGKAVGESSEGEMKGEEIK
ncbi:MAG: hypothetical protein HC866_18105 [Leptolyngbyaceae cyanobacterium RU_5_1]|nr:hypothetical protein [Leptolyngbyaceae cyanobacterium RU_5_1]